MAETAVFSSYRRPGPPAPVPVPDIASEGPVESGPSLELETAEQARLAELPGLKPGLAGQIAAAWTDMTAIPVSSDQLGLIHPSVIQLVASLPNSSAIMLEADTAGLYRPPDFRPAPSGSLVGDWPKSLVIDLAAGPGVELGFADVILADDAALSSDHGASRRG